MEFLAKVNHIFERTGAAISGIEDKESVSTVVDLTMGHVLGLLSIFSRDTLNCGTMRIVRKYSFAKQMIGIAALFLTVEAYMPEEPLVDVAKMTLLVFSSHILLARMTPGSGIAAYAGIYALVLAGIVQRRHPEWQVLRDARKWGTACLIPLVAVGFLAYARKQYREHYENWSTLTFLLGTSGCDD